MSEKPATRHKSSVVNPSTTPSESASAASTASRTRADPCALLALSTVSSSSALTSSSHHGPKRANSSTNVPGLPPAAASVLDDHEPRPHELLAGPQITALAKTGPRRGRPCARPGAMLAVREARKRERSEPLTGRQLLVREHRGDRSVAHRGTLRRANVGLWLKAIASPTHDARDDTQPGP